MEEKTHNVNILRFVFLIFELTREDNLIIKLRSISSNGKEFKPTVDYGVLLYKFWILPGLGACTNCFHVALSLTSLLDRQLCGGCLAAGQCLIKGT